MINKKQREIYTLGLLGEHSEELIPAKHDVELFKKRQNQYKFLKEFQENGGMVSAAVEKAGLSLRIFYMWKARDPAFAKAFDLARESTIDLLTDEMVRRGYHGVEKPYFWQGAQVGTVREYSDTLLKFLAQKLDPSFNPSSPNIGIQGGNFKIEIVPPQDMKALPTNDPNTIIEAEAERIDDDE